MNKRQFRSMKLTNKTHYETRLLRKLLTVCLREFRRREGDPRQIRHLEVTVEHGRSKWIGGRAYLNGRFVRMILPKNFERYTSGNAPQVFARIFIHELGHCVGMRHMKGHAGEGEFWEWIRANIDEERFPLPIAESKRKPKGPLQEKRYLQAVANSKRAETRLKRAQTLAKKWRTKVRYYERALAAKREKGERDCQSQKTSRRK